CSDAMSGCAVTGHTDRNNRLVSLSSTTSPFAERNAGSTSYASGHAQIIDAVARQLANGLRLECRRPAQRDAHLRATGLRQVALDHRRDFRHAGATRLRERAEIELRSEE